MDQQKLFKTINIITEGYSQKPITPSSLDSHVTIQIILESVLDLAVFQFQHSIAALLFKIIGVVANTYVKETKHMKVQNMEKQKKQGKFNIIVVHEYRTKKDHKQNNKMYRKMMQKLIHDVDNVIVMDGHGCIWNNILHYEHQFQCNYNKQNCCSDTQGNPYQHAPAPNCIHIKIGSDVMEDNHQYLNCDRPLLIFLPISNTKQNKNNNQTSRSMQSTSLIDHTVTKQGIKQTNEQQQDSKTAAHRPFNCMGTHDYLYDNQQRYNNLLENLRQYVQICNIFHGHANLRFCLYSENKCRHLLELSSRQKIQYLISTIVGYCDSQDDLDVLIREEIPNDAYMQVCKQCANRVTPEFIKRSDQFVLIKEQIPKYFVFRALQPDQIQTNRQFINPIIAADELAIYVLINGLPIVQLVPLINKPRGKINVKIGTYLSSDNASMNRRKKKIGSKNDKYLEKRSILGYTKVQMENKLFSHLKKFQNNEKQQGTSLKGRQDNFDNESLYGCNSQRSTFSEDSMLFNNDKQEDNLNSCQNSKKVCKCIINITLNKSSNKPGLTQIQQIIEEQTYRILSQFLSKRKEIYQNLQIHKNIMLIKRVSQLINIQQRDLHFILFINKL